METQRLISYVCSAICAWQQMRCLESPTGACFVFNLLILSLEIIKKSLVIYDLVYDLVYNPVYKALCSPWGARPIECINGKFTASNGKFTAFEW